MAESGESGYEGDLESEYEANSELQEEPTNESIEELPDTRSFPDIIYTSHGHRLEEVYSIPNLTIGDSFDERIHFETRCPIFSTIWRCGVKLERAEDKGPISYWIRMKRFDAEDIEMNAAVWVRFRHVASNAFFHEEGFERDVMMRGHEITGAGVVPAEKLQALPNDKLVLQVDVIARLCHGNLKRKRESNSSSDY